MNTQDKIKELIDKYINAIPRALGDKSRSAFKQIVQDLETLLDPECEHLDTQPIKVLIQYEGYEKANLCNDCGVVIKPIE